MSSLLQDLPAVLRPSAALLLWPLSVLVYAGTAATHAGQAGFAAALPLLLLLAWMALGAARAARAVDPPVLALLIGWSLWALLTQLPPRSTLIHAWGPALAVPLLGASVLVAQLSADRQRLQRELATGAALAVLFAAACCPLLLAIGRPLESALIFGFDNLNLITLLTTPLIVIGLLGLGTAHGDRIRRILLWAALAYLLLIGILTGRRGQSLFLLFAALLWLARSWPPQRALRCWRWGLPLAALAALLGLGLLLTLPSNSPALDQLRALDAKRVAIYRATLPASPGEWLLGRGSGASLQPGVAVDERDWRYLNDALGPLGHAHDSVLQQLAASGLPAALALLGLIALGLWRATQIPDQREGDIRRIAIIGAGLSMLFEDLSTRPEGAVGLGLLLGLALGSGSNLRRGNVAAAHLVLIGGALSACLLLVLWWRPTWTRDAPLAAELQALEAARDPSHALWQLHRLIERVDALDPVTMQRIRGAVEARLGPVQALRWAALAEPAQQPGDAALWARLHPLDLGTAALHPEGPAPERIVAGRSLVAVYRGELPRAEANARLRTILARFPSDPALTWSLLRIRSREPELIDALELHWEQLPTWPLSWAGADAELAAGLQGLPEATRAKLQESLYAMTDRQPVGAIWAQRLFTPDAR